MAQEQELLGNSKMKAKIKELLAVLDMPKPDEQLYWLKEHREEFGIDNHPASYPLRGFPRAAKFFLADLAFRLRDEAVKKSIGFWRDGQLAVFYHVAKQNVWRVSDLDMWFARHTQPIHWIISSLIAKELAK